MAAQEVGHQRRFLMLGRLLQVVLGASAAAAALYGVNRLVSPYVSRWYERWVRSVAAKGREAEPPASSKPPTLSLRPSRSGLDWPQSECLSHLQCAVSNACLCNLVIIPARLGELFSAQPRSNGALG